MKRLRQFVLGCLLLCLPRLGKAQDWGCGIYCKDCVSFTTQATGTGPPAPGQPWYVNWNCVVLSNSCDGGCGASFEVSYAVGKALKSAKLNLVSRTIHENYDHIFLDKQRRLLVVRERGCKDKNTDVVSSVTFLSEKQLAIVARMPVRGVDEMGQTPRLITRMESPRRGVLGHY